ncbi:MAG: hypothetical protein Q8M20_13555 [Rhodocyclaceae bacterium]|nr:hypothetical protein [Rhodocyclaceae bacterium]MDZ4216025.1 hypothetical protein [Rhodocyclaceae bacterium]
MKTLLHRFVPVILIAPTIALAAPPAFDVQTTSTSVIVKNLTSDNHMEMLINVGGCGKKVMAGPGGVVTVPLQNDKRDIDVKSVKLTPMRQLIAEAKANPQPAPQPVTAPKIISSMQPVCLDLK